MKMTCHYTPCNEPISLGKWEMKETEKTITFTQIDGNYEPFRCRKNNKCKHCLKDWEDGTYTVYPNRS